MARVVLQCVVFAVPWWWCPTKNSLSDCYSPVELSYISPLGHQVQAIKGGPCMDCVWPRVSAVWLENALSVCTLALGWGWENAAPTHLFHPGGRRVGWWGEGICNHSHLQTLAREWENAVTLSAPWSHVGRRECWNVCNHSLWFQKGSGTVPRPLIPACLSRVAGGCRDTAHPLV